jgi:hypothetical protein
MKKRKPFTSDDLIASRDALAKMDSTFDPEKHDHFFGHLIQQYVDELLSRVNPAVKIHYDDLYIYMPEPYIEKWLKFLFAQTAIQKQEVDGNFIKYRGYRVLPGYENKIIIAHKKAAVINDPGYLVSKDLR